MELVSFLLNIVGLPLTIGIAVWEHRRVVSERQASREMLSAVVAEQMGRILEAGPPRTDALEVAMGDRDARVRRVFPADVTSDGQNELLVEYEMGAHSSGLKVFAWRDFDLHSVGELWSDSETMFEVGDFDGDGRNEVRALQSDWSNPDLSYAERPWVRVTYRWEYGEFRFLGSEPYDFGDEHAVAAQV